jgi:hypothetical protein
LRLFTKLYLDSIAYRDTLTRPEPPAPKRPASPTKGGLFRSRLSHFSSCSPPSPCRPVAPSLRRFVVSVRSDSKVGHLTMSQTLTHLTPSSPSRQNHVFIRNMVNHALVRSVGKTTTRVVGSETARLSATIGLGQRAHSSPNPAHGPSRAGFVAGAWRKWSALSGLFQAS